VQVSLRAELSANFQQRTAIIVSRTIEKWSMRSCIRLRTGSNSRAITATSRIRPTGRNRAAQLCTSSATPATSPNYISYYDRRGQRVPATATLE